MSVFLVNVPFPVIVQGFPPGICGIGKCLWPVIRKMVCSFQAGYPSFQPEVRGGPPGFHLPLESLQHVEARMAFAFSAPPTVHVVIHVAVELVCIGINPGLDFYFP